MSKITAIYKICPLKNKECNPDKCTFQDLDTEECLFREMMKAIIKRS